MPYTLNGIGTMYYGQKNFREYAGTCDSCGKPTNLRSYQTTLWFTVFFIPIIPLGKKMILDYCTSCNRHRAMPLKEWNTIKEQSIAQNTETLKTNPNDPQSCISALANLDMFGSRQEANQLAAEVERKFPNNLEVQLYLGTYYEKNRQHDLADICFERALKANPDNLTARRAVGVGCIQKNDLPRAGSLLSFMLNPGPEQDLGVLLFLANSYQKNGQHGEAYSYYQIIVRDFPQFAQKDKAFRKAVKKTETFIGRSYTALPKNEAQLKALKIAAGVLVGIFGILFLLNWQLQSHQTLYLINQLKLQATILLPDQDPVSIAAGEKKTIKVPEGEYEAEVRIAQQPAQKVKIAILNSLWTRFFSDKVFILNVGGGAVVLLESIVYSTNPDPKDDYKVRIYTGDSFMIMDEPDYVFEPAPQTVTLDQGSTAEIKTRLDFLSVAPAYIVPYLSENKIPAQKILTYCQTHLDIMPDNLQLLSQYYYYAWISGNLKPCLTYLEKHLRTRPVRVEYHRFYQEGKEALGDNKSLLSQYDTLLAKEPDNSDLNYLRGRLEKDVPRAFVYYDRAIQANPKNAYPYSAKSYHLTCAGDFVMARNLCATAYSLKPDPRTESSFFDLRFALKEYEALEKEATASLSKNPIDMTYFLRVLQLQVAQNNIIKAEKTLKAFQVLYKKEQPDDIYQTKLISLLSLDSFKGDYESSVQDATQLQDPVTRDFYLKNAYLSLGDMEKAEALPDVKTHATSYDCLIYWLGWLEKGEKDKAAQWFERAQKAFDQSKQDDQVVGEWLQNPSGEIGEKLKQVNILPDQKRILYTVFAKLVPGERAMFLEQAEKMNFNLDFPYHFLLKSIDQMKRKV